MKVDYFILFREIVLPVLAFAALICLGLFSRRDEPGAPLTWVLIFIGLLSVGGGVAMGLGVLLLWLGVSVERAYGWTGAGIGAWMVWSYFRAQDWGWNWEDDADGVEDRAETGTVVPPSKADGAA